MDNLPGEVLTDIRALADQFLIAFPNINKRLATSQFAVRVVTAVSSGPRSARRHAGRRRRRGWLGAGE